MSKIDYKEYRGQNMMVGEGAYHLITGLMFLYGIATIFTVQFFLPVLLPDHDYRVFFFLLYFISGIVGFYLMKLVTSPLISFLGFTMMMVAYAVCISLLIFIPASSLQSFLVMLGIVVAIMSLLGFFVPEIFDDMATSLFTMPLVAIIVKAIEWCFFTSSTNILWSLVIDGFLLFLVSLLLGYYWSNLTQKPKTLDNAIDGGMYLFLALPAFIMKCLYILFRKIYYEWIDE